MSTDTQATWIYGVVPAGASLDELQRRDDLPDVWLVESDDLAAVVSDVPADDEEATRDQALAHARVLEAAVLDATVVPFRFGTIAEDGDEAVDTDLLQARHDELVELLDKVDGHVQMSLKVHYREDVILREIVEREPEIQELRETISEQDEPARDDQVRLGELVNTALEQARERDCADILQRLKGAAVAVVAEPLEHELMVLNASYLLDRDAQQDFEQALEEVAQERQDRMTFRLLGPMPAYSFVGAEETAWA